MSVFGVLRRVFGQHNKVRPLLEQHITCVQVKQRDWFKPEDTCDLLAPGCPCGTLEKL